MTVPLIEFQNISKQYRVGDVLSTPVNEVTLSINKGDFVSITGPSGSGKSTLLNLLGLLERPSDGRLFYNGTELNTMSASQLNRFRIGKIGYVFQNFHLLDRLSVKDNIALPLKYAKQSKESIEASVHDIAKQLNIEHRLNHMPRQLSGGQQQRVACARAFISGADIILADEPTGNLDQQSGLEVMSILSKLNGNGTTIVLVTHDLNLAKQTTLRHKMSDGVLLS